jgi:hypothetical protein
MSSRRKFIGQISTIGVMAGLPGIFIPTQNKTDKKIWACHLHLSFNFAAGRSNKQSRIFETDESVWDAAIERMAMQGVNMVVILKPNSFSVFMLVLFTHNFIKKHCSNLLQRSFLLCCE